MNSPTAELIYDCADFVALNKPSGLSVLKDRSGAPCLWDALPELIGGKPYQVHRLDKGTSGVMLIARTAVAQKQLSASFRLRTARKFYLCWVVGAPPVAGLINLPLKKGRKSRYRIAGERADIEHRPDRGWSLANPGGEGVDAQTRIRLLKSGPRSLLLAAPKTGRTHQLRVHLSWIGYPIVGDHLYGRPSDPLQRADRLQLHCHRLVVPGVGSFTARLPAEGWLESPGEA